MAFQGVLHLRYWYKIDDNTIEYGNTNYSIVNEFKMIHGTLFFQNIKHHKLCILLIVFFDTLENSLMYNS